MKLSTITSIVFLIFTILIVKARACEDDEECLPITECVEERKYLRDFQKLRTLKVCGIYYGTTSHCCKITPTGLTTLSSHKNFRLINHNHCGQLNHERIVGGSRAPKGAYPWLALLRYRSQIDDLMSFNCAGSLITLNYVLTAAHCLRARGIQLASVRLGEHTISTAIDCDVPGDTETCDYDEPLLQDIEVDKTIIHDGHDPVQKLHDIALVKLKTNAIMTSKVDTVCLPVDTKQFLDKILIKENLVLQMTIAGWGTTEKSGKASSDVLLHARVPYMTSVECAEKFRELQTRHKSIRIDIQRSHLCAGGFNQTDTCQGDSGGPIMYPALNEKGAYRMFQYGIVSAGIDCSMHEPFPGLYTRVTRHMKWILDNISD